MPQTRIGNLIPGHTWLEGAGLPPAAIGSKFQYYLNTTNQDVYQKQDETTWLKIGNLNGAGILTGVGAPAPSLGSIGNWYEDLSTGELYEKTALTVWTLRGDIIENPNIQAHISDISTNPHQVTAAQAGAEPANANIQAHIADVTTNPHAVTAAQTGAEPADPNIQAHIADTTSNPHDVTAAQTGAEPANANIQAHIGDTTTNPHEIRGLLTSGAGVPAAGYGEVFDFYEDTDTGNLYEKTDSTTWSPRGNVYPPVVPPAAVGVWFADTVDPSTGIGQIGDFFVNTTSKNVYYQSDVDVWDLIGNLGGGGGGSSVGIWLSGYGVPDPSLSVIGNWYVDMNVWEVYKKTSGVVWEFYGSIAPVNLVRDLIASVFIPAGYTMSQYHIELDTGAVLTVEGKLYYRTLDTTNGTLDSTLGLVFPTM